MSLGGEGYLTFMGNEFGHPEWIDFPREGNGWSYHYCRRQWSLAENPELKYQYLRSFDREMVKLAKKNRILQSRDLQRRLDNREKILVYEKGSCVFAFNFHPENSYTDCWIPVDLGKYQVVMSTDDFQFGGQGRIHYLTYEAVEQPDGGTGFRLYLPSRTAVVLKKMK